MLGMSEPLYRRVAGLITVHSRRPWINLATAPPGVLLALPGLDDAGRGLIIEGRGMAEDEADAPATPPAVSPTRFGRVARTGGVVTVRAEARTASGGIFIREAIVRVGGERETPYEYLGWRQGARRESPN